MLNAISQVKFFTKDVQNYKDIIKHVEVLRKLTASHMSQSEQNEVLRILNQFGALCYGNYHYFYFL